MRSQIVLILFTILLATSAFGQKTRYLNAGPGGAYSLHNDRGLSPLPYEGLQFAGHFGIERNKNRKWTEFSLHLQGGFLSPVEKAGSATRGFFSASYRHLFQMNAEDNKSSIHLGPAVNILADNVIHDQYSNNIIHPFWDATVGIAARASRNFYLFKRRFNAAFLMQVPLWGAGIRPDYAFGSPRGFYQYPDDYWKAVRESYFYVYPPKLIRVQTDMSLTYYLKNGNAFGLVYHWHYSRLVPLASDGINGAEAAGHGLYLITKFRF